MAAKKKAAPKKAADKSQTKKEKAAEKKAPQAQKSVLQLLTELDEENGTRHVELRARDPADYLSTGILSLDLIMGGGYVGGRFIQFYGRPHVGKSTVGYLSAGHLQKRGVFTTFLDHEATTEQPYIAKLGVRTDNVKPMMRYYKPMHGVESYERVMKICQGLPDMDYGRPQAAFVLDTVAQMATQEEMEDWKEATRMAMRAAMHSTWMNRIKTLVSKKNIVIIALNQIRASMASYGSPESIPGGNAWAFGTDMLVKVAAGKDVIVGADIYRPMILKTFKNKLFRSHQECEVYLQLGEGIDPASDVIQFLKKVGMYRLATVPDTKGKKKEPLIEGLDNYGTKLDGRYGSVLDFTKLIRQQSADGVSPFFEACRNMLASGDAVKKMLEEQQRKIKAGEAKEPDENEEATSTEADGPSEEEEAATRAMLAKLKKNKAKQQTEQTEVDPVTAA